MIIREHAVIRTTDADDAGLLHAIYRGGAPRFALLDQKREPMMPTRLEIQEMLASQDLSKSLFYSVEDREGRLRGFAVLRGMNQESGYCELTLMPGDEEDCRGPLAEEAVEYACGRAFGQLRLRKVVSHLLCRESAAQELLERQGFAFAGAQREAVYAGGRWHDIRAYSRYNPAA